MRITTARLELVPLTSADAADLFAALDDPALGRWTGETPPTDIAALQTRYALWESRRSPDGDELWLNWVARRRDDVAVGHLQATVSESAAAIAWVVATPHQGQGLATEAARALVAWLLEELGVTSIVASIHPGHVASQTVARRAGLIPTDRMDDGEQVWEHTPSA